MSGTSKQRRLICVLFLALGMLCMRLTFPWAHCHRFVDVSGGTNCQANHTRAPYQPQLGSTYFNERWEPTSIGVQPPANGGVLCPTSQPPWSAYREPTFGFGKLTIFDATRAEWAFYSNLAAPGVAADVVTIKRNDKGSCRLKRAAVMLA